MPNQWTNNSPETSHVKRVGFRLPNTLRAALEAKAIATGKPVSALVRDTLARSMVEAD